MANLLLSTKLRVPPVRGNLVPRPRLLYKLNQALATPVTLVSAPPGFGKTTLLTDWLQHQPLPVAWYSLDESDNDLARFLTYLVAALANTHPNFGRTVLSRLHSRKQTPLESVMPLLINELAEIQQDFLFVLDDYHQIELQDVHRALAFLVDQLPPRLHLILATRADPPLPLARLRARGQLLELRAPDLRFSVGEAGQFLSERMGLNLSEAQVAALEARTEGWIAGLQLAALSMQGRQDTAGFVNAFTGSNRFILDYLAGEVLQRQTPDIQTFLLQTSILDQISGSLGDALTGRQDSAQVLAELEKLNLFLFPLDDTRHWYRYHHLFADLLQNRLQEIYPGQVPELHRRASTWYEQNGLNHAAIEHALAASEYPRAARLIEQVGLALVLRSEYETLLGWIEPLPDALIRQRPYLHLIYAMALMMMGKLSLGAAHMAQIDDTTLDSQGRVIASMLRPAFALLQSDMDHALESARLTLEQAEASPIDPGDPQAELNAAAILYMAVLLAELQFAAGQLQAVAASCRRGLELARLVRVGDPWELILAYIYYTLAQVFYEWNELETATRHATHSLEVCRRAGNEEIESYILTTLAQIKQAQGDAASASNLLEQSMQIGLKRKIAGEMLYLAPRQVKLLISHGRIGEAASMVGDLPDQVEGVWFMERGLKEEARALVLLAQQEFDQAAELLKRLESDGETPLQNGRLIEILPLLALAENGRGDTARGSATLKRALALGAPERYMRTFLDLGEPMRLRIADYRLRMEKDGDATDLAEYVDRLLAAFPVAHESVPQSAFRGPQSATLREPLSERELAVLRLIAEGLSNQEIGERMIVALSTVKTHINNIYGKLGVSSRTQALARAREMKLL